MSGYELFKEMSELDADLVMAPPKFVSLRMNILLCIISANISGLIPHSQTVLSLIVFITSFALLYGLTFWMLNCKRKKRLLIENCDTL